MAEMEQKLKTYTEELERLKGQSTVVNESTGNETETEKFVQTIEKIANNTDTIKSTSELDVSKTHFEQYITQSFKSYTTKIFYEKDEKSDDEINFTRTAEEGNEEEEDANPVVLKEEDSSGVFNFSNLLMKEENQKRFVTRMKWNERDKAFLSENNEILTDNVFIRAIPFDINRKYLTSREAQQHVDKGKELKISTNYENFTQFVPGFIWDNSFSEKRFLLKVEIKNIQFLMHRLSSLEFFYTQKLKKLYKDYKEMEELNRSNYYETRIKILRNMLREKDCDELHLLDDIILTEEKLDNEEMKMRQFRDEMTVLWREIDSNRKKNGYTETSVELQWQSSQMTEEEKQEDIKKYEIELKIRAAEISRLNKLIGGEPLDKKDVIESIRTKHSEMGLRLPGDCKWSPLLEETSVSSLKELPEEEQKRINEVLDTYIYVKVLVGDVSSISLASSLNESFVSNVCFGTKILVTRIPKYVKVQVWEQGPHGVSKLSETAIPVFTGQPIGYSEFAFTCEKPTEEGVIQEGSIFGAAFIASNPKLTAKQIQESKRKQEAREKLLSTTLPDKVRADILKSPSLDPNDPTTIAAMSIGAQDFTIRKSITEFKLDNRVHTLTFDAMAPSKKYSEDLKIKKEDDESDNEEKPITIRVFERDDVIRDSLLQPIFKWFISLFERRRPLKPHELVLTEDTVINLSTKLEVRITQFLNEPRRTPMTLITPQIRNLGYSSEQGEQCSYFVVATVGSESYKTDPVKAVEGFWKADFEFDIGSHKNSTNETLNISVFDRMKYTFPEDEKEEEETHYIGEINIPLASIEANGRAKGDFIITTPPLSIGYSYQGKPMLLMDINFSPNINPKFPNEVQYFVNGSKVPLSALITPIDLPPGVKNINSLMRFTSMIPWAKAEENFLVTSQEFIEQGFGTTLEHAIFFYNCLLSLKRKGFIIIADDAFLGEAAFVFTQDKGTRRFYDVVNNRVYCGPPFRRIYIAFNEEGTWFNTNPSEVSLDFQESPQWELIDDGREEKVQDSNMQYAETEINIEQLEEKLTDEIKKHVATLVTEKISWNKSLSLNLGVIIDNCETAAEKRSVPEEADFFSDNSNLRAGGAPFCTYFNRNMSIDELILTISVTIQNQMFYVIKGPKTKLGISVKAYPHPNGIVAVWVFIAAIQQLPKLEHI